MRRALVWLNLYGREAVRHKPQNCLKTQKMQGWLREELYYLCQIITLAFLVLAIYNFVLPQPLPTYVLESTYIA